MAAHPECLHKLSTGAAGDCKRIALRPESAPPPAAPSASVASSSWDHLGDAAAAAARRTRQSVDGATPSIGAIRTTPPPHTPLPGTGHVRAHSVGSLTQSSPPHGHSGRGDYDRGWARMVHHWVSAPEGTLDGDLGVDDKPLALTAKCVVCRTPCRTGLLAPEPLYKCLWCGSLAHGECVAATVGSARTSSSAANGQQQPPQPQKDGGAESTGDADGAAAAGNGHAAAQALPPAASSGSLSSGSSSARSWCSLGGYRHMIVPPVYIRELPRAVTPADTPRGVRNSSSGGSTGLPGFGSHWHSQEIVNKAMQKAAQLRRRARRKLGKLQARSSQAVPGGGTTDLGSDDDDDLPSAAQAAPPRLPAAAYELLRLPPDARPLLVFVNRRSGPQAGGALIRQLKRALNPLQVWELPGEHGGPEAALTLFARVPRLRIAVAGGDGTAGWVLAALDDLWEREQLTSDTPKPPVAILPLGTGNDLARVLGWASSDGWGLEKGAPDVDRFLHDVDCSTVALLDRWSVSLVEGPEAGATSGGVSCVRKLMNNYLSLGMDAKVALDFHSTREAHPDWFQSQAGNKLWYTGVAASELLSHSCQGLPRKCRVECDGVVLDIPPQVEGIVILNIASYMGGVELWTRRRPKRGGQAGSSGARLADAAGLSDDADSSGDDTDGDGDDPRLSGMTLGSNAAGERHGLGPQAMNDRLLEVVGHYGTWHLGKLHIGMSRALQLAQCSVVRITTTAPLPMQVDGEPWMQEEDCTVTIEHHSQALMLRRSRGEGSGAVMGVVSSVLDQAAAERFITTEQHRALVTEIARRLP